MDTKDINRRFTHHPPRDAWVVEQHEITRDHFKALAFELNHRLPDGREKSLALTKLEEGLFWANAAIARAESNAVDVDTPPMQVTDNERGHTSG